MRRVRLLLLVGLLCPAPLDAQFDQRWALHAGGRYTAGLPYDLYAGVMTVIWPGEKTPNVIRTRYTERVNVQTGVGGELFLVRNDHAYFGLRARRGNASTTAEFNGGQAPPETLDRELSWWGLDLLAGITLNRTSRLRWVLFAGPSFTRWTLATGGRGRDALADPVHYAELGRPPIHWPDRRWQSTGFVLNTDLRFTIGPRVAVRVGFEQRLGTAGNSAFVRSDLEALEPVVGTPNSVDYITYWQSPRAFSVGLDVKLGERVRRDPGVLAVEALRERSAEDDPDFGALLPADARAALERADTAAAIAALEAAVAASPDDLPLLGELAILLAYSAPAEEKDFVQRLRATTMLRDLLRRDPGNPRYLMALGALLEKRRMFDDSRRVLSRALTATAERPEDIALDDIAEVFYQRGRTLEAHVQDFENLKYTALEAVPSQSGGCAGPGGAFCDNWARPRSFFEWFARLGTLDHLVRDQRDAMIREYRRALEVSPRHAGANRALLGVLARQGDWREFAAVAAQWADAAPADPWARLAHATGLLWTGRGEEAWTAFRAAIAELPDADRRIFLDLRPILGKDDEAAWNSLPEHDRFRERYWASRDPLLLTGWNEREAEHYARVTLAEILFREPQTARRGWETDRGQILVRYGRPATMWQVTREHQPLTMSGTMRSSGGRWIFWNYDPDMPSFLFERLVGRARVAHMSASMSAAQAEDWKATNPTGWVPPYADAGRIAHQVASFRSADGAGYDVELYALAPAALLAAAPGEPFRTGWFVAPAQDDPAPDAPLPANVHEETRSQVAGTIDLHVTLPPGGYDYALEMLSADTSIMAGAGGRVALPAPAPGALALSDLLATEPGLAGPEDGAALHRSAIEYRPLRCLALPGEQRVGLVFEVYGLEAEAQDSVVRYRVSIEAQELRGGNLVARLLRAWGIGGDQRELAGRLTFEREVRLTGDRVVEWVELEIPPAGREAVDVTVQVEDLVGRGRTAHASRRLGAQECM